MKVVTDFVEHRLLLVTDFAQQSNQSKESFSTNSMFKKAKTYFLGVDSYCVTIFNSMPTSGRISSSPSDVSECQFIPQSLRLI